MEAEKEKKENPEGSDDDEETEEEVSQEQLDLGLLQACKENNIEEVNAALAAGANPQFRKDGWSSLLWAACNGNEDLVRILINKDAGSEYLNRATSEAEEAQDDKKVQLADDEEENPFVKPMDASKHGKYTPLHWASYKGYYKVVWILLKYGISPLDIDMYGNTSVHQAAASGNLKVLQCYLSRGVNLNKWNSRKHTPLDLTTEPETKKLILRARNTTHCQNTGCRSKFDFKNIQYYCEASGQFFCKNCTVRSWVYENHSSQDEERPVCRSNPVQARIEKHEQQLQEAIASYEFHTIDKVLTSCHGIDIDVKLRKHAEVLHLKLEHELKIQNFLKKNEHHDNYKDIRKDVQRVNELVETAEGLGIELDPAITTTVGEYTQKIISERNLRKQRDLYLESICTCDQEKVDKLQNLIDVANQNNVDNVYINNAEVLSNQMSGNIKARETLQMLRDYPPREYPEPEEADPKNKGKKAPPPPPPKKKKKKEPAFPTPEWALELDAVITKVKQMEQLAADRQNLKLDDEFCQGVTEMLQRFKKEIAFRKMLLEQEKLEAELKALKKQKAKKK